MTLHLLRGVPPNINGEPVDFETFRRLVRLWASSEPPHVFGSWTRNKPRRASELDGGSVYFVRKGETLFRMPFLGLERVGDFAPDAEPHYLNHTAIVCAPRIVMVEAHKVRFLRGWRYLEEKDAPPDLPGEGKGRPGDVPPAMQRELREMGLL